jgi:hypothetical protein
MSGKTREEHIVNEESCSQWKHLSCGNGTKGSRHIHGGEAACRIIQGNPDDENDVKSGTRLASHPQSAER